MQAASVNFAICWSATLLVLGAAASVAIRSRPHISFDRVGMLFMVGLAAGLALYLAPSGLSSVQSTRDLELRFFAALGISWLVALRQLPAGAGPIGFSALALAGFAGVNAPLLALVASSMIVCGTGDPTCALYSP